MMNGQFAVIVSQRGCVDTSTCYNITNVGLPKNDFGHALEVFPNPTFDQVSVDLGKAYEGVSIYVINMLGQLVFEKKYKHLQKTSLNLGDAKGVYLF